MLKRSLASESAAAAVLSRDKERLLAEAKEEAERRTEAQQKAGQLQLLLIQATCAFGILNFAPGSGMKSDALKADGLCLQNVFHVFALLG